MTAGTYADVVLITDDRHLRESVRRHRPDGAALRCLTSAAADRAETLTGRQVWIDLDCAPGTAAPGGQRRVYFYSRGQPAGDDLPPGLFIRKPGTAAVFQVLWAGVAGAAPDPAAAAAGGSRWLPDWLLDFHDLRLKPLCNKLVVALGPRLGYRAASLYLYEPARRLLTLAGTTHQRSIDLAVPLDAGQARLMAAVARGGTLLRTDRAQEELAARGIPPATDRSYEDDACLVAPLTCEGRLVGVLNLSGCARRPPAAKSLPLAPIFEFLGRALHHARAHEHAQTEARVDCLTGLFNQRWILEALEREIHRAQRFRTALSVLMLDLDGLKAINDRAGHAAGDCLLQHVAGRVSGVLRHFDGAARVGGDEFVIMLPATALAGARQVGRRLLQAVRSETGTFRGTPLPITVSIGAAEWRPGWDARQLLEAADRAMYAAKQRGRDNLVCEPVSRPGTIRLGPATAAPPDGRRGPAGTGPQPAVQPPAPPDDAAPPAPVAGPAREAAAPDNPRG